MKSVKFIALIIVFITFCTAKVFSQWETQDSGVETDLFSVAFTDTLHGWIVGSGKVLLQTLDGGDNWIQKEMPDSIESLGEIQFVNKSVGFLYVRPKGFLVTKDSGLSWDFRPLDIVDWPIWDFFFVNENEGWVVGGEDWFQNSSQDTSFILKTSDGGLSWETQYMKEGNNLHSISFLDNQYGLACGSEHMDGIDDTYFIKTENGGVDWNNLGENEHPRFSFIIFDNANIQAGFDQSSDSGKTWNYNYDYIQRYTSDEVRIDETSCYVLNSEISKGFFLSLSTDMGKTWRETSVPALGLSAISSPNINNVWVVGNHGSIFKFNNDITSIETKETIDKINFKFYNNYPNPSNSSTIFSYYISESDYVNLTIYSITGEKIKTLVDEIQESGTYNIQYIHNLSASGIFFAKLQYNNQFEFLKFVILN